MNSDSLDYIDDLYVQYLRDPSSVSETWRRYFEQFLVTGSDGGAASAGGSDNGRTGSNTAGAGHGSSHANGATGGNGSARDNGSVLGHPSAPANGSTAGGTHGGHHADATASRNGHASSSLSDRDAARWAASIQDRVNYLVREYRVRGHLAADLDPLKLDRNDAPDFSPAKYGLSPEDLEAAYDSTVVDQSYGQNVRSILDRLHETYCRRIGVQFMHINNRSIREWLQHRMESTQNRLELSRDQQRRIYTRLADASIFEEYLRRKFVGAKTFSLEGAESLIPMIDLALEKAGGQGVREVVMAMAHRGRLNVMANILKKRAMNIFWSFDDPNPELSRGGGDVRYHLGYSSNWTTAAGQEIHISLCFNPSHLEYVNTVAQGRCRSKQDRRGDTDRKEVMTLLIHGDAAFAGEGIVQETLNLSQLDGYHTGGTLHIVINNQVGFTTLPDQGRSTTYATDVAKMLQIPIFHVNGEDPEAVAQAVSLAMDFRAEFARDVVIDLYAFRRWGHNEGDEPRFTQPQMYNEIDNHQSIRAQYARRLQKLGQLTEDDVQKITQERLDKLESGFEASQNEKFTPDTQTLTKNWADFHGGPEPTDPVDTGVDRDQLVEWIDALTRLPDGFSPHKKLKRPIQLRRKMATGEQPIDWATAELTAFASFLSEGRTVRMTGQDCQRGTFSQRHAVYHDIKTGQTHTPLEALAGDEGMLELFNSPLSEAGVMGFEWGYSLDCPDGLVAWEAQFGDFWNCAQVIVDQFIASAEDKWNRLSGLVLLLPHGFEGQGPEHCSARIERWLAMTAEDNIQVVQPTTPAQHFHVLRRQVVSKWRKPLIVMTPKGLLRHKSCVSTIEDLHDGQFEKILIDPEVKTQTPRRVLMCTGKIYYDLIARRTELGIDDVPIIRVEQLYPLSIEELMTPLEAYPEGTDLVWIQDEPTNMGVWPYLKFKYGDDLNAKFKLRRISRIESASPSTGSANAHKLEHRDLMHEAFKGLDT